MPLFHTDHESHEKPRIDEFKDSWNFVNLLLIRDAVRFSNDTDTIVLRIFVGFDWIRLKSHEYCQECTTIDKNSLTNTARMLEISYELVKNMPNPVRIEMYS